MPSPQHTERKAEAAARNALRGAGCRVVNANRAIGRGYPVIDLVARRGIARMLVQVRGTWNVDGRFTATPAQNRALAALAASRGCHAIWAFVHITSDGTTVRFATAAQVTRLAEEGEARAPGTSRYSCVYITQLEIDSSRIAELLNG
jgi:Holliday junction resolvase-like predicted endonuclease